MLLEDVEGGGVLVVQTGVHSLPILSQVDPGSVSHFSILWHLDFEPIRQKVTNRQAQLYSIGGKQLWQLYLLQQSH